MAFIAILMTIWVIVSGKENTTFLDGKIFHFVQSLDQTYLYKFARLFTKLGSKVYLIPFTIFMCFLFLWLSRHWLPSLFLAGGTLVSHLLNQFIKHMIQRERPSIIAEADAIGYSFPSGHAMISIVCYGLCLYFLLYKVTRSLAAFNLKLLVSLLILCIGLSRVIINVHYLTDVIGGFAFGFVLLMGLIKLYESITRKYLSVTHISASRLTTKKTSVGFIKIQF